MRRRRRYGLIRSRVYLDLCDIRIPVLVGCLWELNRDVGISRAVRHVSTPSDKRSGASWKGLQCRACLPLVWRVAQLHRVRREPALSLLPAVLSVVQCDPPYTSSVRGVDFYGNPLASVNRKVVYSYQRIKIVVDHVACWKPRRIPESACFDAFASHGMRGVEGWHWWRIW